MTPADEIDAARRDAATRADQMLATALATAAGPGPTPVTIDNLFPAPPTTPAEFAAAGYEVHQPTGEPGRWHVGGRDETGYGTLYLLSRNTDGSRWDATWFGRDRTSGRGSGMTADEAVQCFPPTEDGRLAAAALVANACPPDDPDEAALSAETTRVRAQLVAELKAAHQGTGKAHTLLSLLCGDLYDVEYVDSSVGTDIAHHLGDAARSLRAAVALATGANR